MKLAYTILTVAFLATLAPSSKAWNCNNPLAERVDIGSTKPSSKAGDGDGQWYKGNDASNPNDYYVCKVVSPKPAKPAKPSTTNQTTQGQGQEQTQGQSQTQSASSVATSSANSSSSSAANNNGNGSNNASYSSETNIAAPKIPVNTAYAPTTIPTMSCFKTYSGGAQTAPFGVSIGGGKVDENCRKLETAMHATNQLVFCKIYITTKDAKQAGVTLQDCLGPEPTPVPTVEYRDRIVEKRIEVPVPQAPPTARLVGECATLDNVCKRQLDDIVRQLIDDPTVTLAIVGAYGPTSVYLQSEKKIDASRLVYKNGKRIRFYIVPQGAVIPN